MLIQIVWRFAATRLVVRTAGLRMQGSAAPLAMMLGVFLLKYAASVAWAAAPQLRRDPMFAGALCVLSGVSNGCFPGAMIRGLGV